MKGFTIKKYSTFMLLILLNLIHSQAANYNVNKICQSGLREDNSNYIYCSRQDLAAIPSFFSDNPSATDSLNTNGLSNTFYDELVLTDNLIEQIDIGSFGSALKVRKLYLDHNPIRYIHNLAFKHVRNYLEELYFNQKLTTDENNYNTDDTVIFQNSVFQMCFNLHLLSIQNYQLNALKPFQFLRMSKLQKLVLSNNKMTHIDENAFKGLEKSLEVLNLDSNLLETVPVAAIRNLVSLNKLSLSQNRIKTIHANSFGSLRSLEALDLSYNLLRKMDKNSIGGSARQSLKSIQLQNNELKWTNFIELLKSLPVLADLNLDFNRIARPIKVIQYLDKRALNATTTRLALQSLSIQGNRLTENDLRMLIEPYKKETYLDSPQFKYPYKKTYNLFDPNAIRYSRFTFPNLLKLNLARNKIGNIPGNFFYASNTSKLDSLILDRNPLDSITANYFNGLEKSLKTLCLNNVGFNIWSPSSVEAFLRLERLQTLKLNGNTQKIHSFTVNKLKLGLLQFIIS